MRDGERWTWQEATRSRRPVVRCQGVDRTGIGRTTLISVARHDTSHRSRRVATESDRRSSPRHSRWCAPPASRFETIDFDLGGARYLRDGEILSDATLAELRGFDAILLGAVGTPEVPPGVIERGLLLKMRFELDLYINQRPFGGTAPGAHRAPRVRRDPGEHRGSVRR